MRKFKVIVLMLQTIRKKPFEAGEIVSEDNLPSGQADELITKGFLEEVFPEKKKAEKEPAKENVEGDTEESGEDNAKWSKKK